MAEPRGTGEMQGQLIKNERRGFYPESKIVSKWAEIGDTSLDGLDLKDFNRRMLRYNDYHPTHLATRIVRSGIFVAAGFPPFQHPELIVECTKHYSPRDRTIRDSERNILADFSPTIISEAFGIPSNPRMVTKTQEQALRIYTFGINFCEEIINKRWLKKNRPHHSKIPKEKVWLDLQREYSDMVMMLSCIFGMPYSYRFESWMWYFVE